MIDNFLQLKSCYTAKCKKEVEDRRQLRDEWNNKSDQIYNDYINKKITKQEFIKKLNKLDEDYYNSVKNINLYNCEIDKCYKYAKKQLDYMAAKVNYPIKKTYTSNDYKELQILTSKIK